MLFIYNVDTTVFWRSLTECMDIYIQSVFFFPCKISSGLRIIEINIKNKI